MREVNLIVVEYEKEEGANLIINDMLVAGREYTARDNVIGRFEFYLSDERLRECFGAGVFR